MAEYDYALSLPEIPDRLRSLSSRLHIDEVVHDGLDNVVNQATQCAKTFARKLEENTEQIYIHGALLKKAKKPKDVNAKALEKTLTQTRASYDFTRSEIYELQIKVQSLTEDCRGQVNAHKQETNQKKIKIETIKFEIQGLKEKIESYEEDAANLDHCARQLDDRAKNLNRMAEEKKVQGVLGGFISAAVGIVLAPFTAGVSLIGAAAAAGVTIGVNFSDAGKCENEARCCRNEAEKNRHRANRVKFDVTRMDTDIDRLEGHIEQMKERIGELEDAIWALEGIKRILLSSVRSSDEVVHALQNMDTIFKETLLARSGFVASLNAKEASVAERQLENLKAAFLRVQQAMENHNRYALGDLLNAIKLKAMKSHRRYAISDLLKLNKLYIVSLTILCISLFWYILC